MLFAKEWCFHERFELDEHHEELLGTFKCTFHKKIPVAGHLYISERYCCFYSNILTKVVKVKIRIRDIISIRKKKAAFLVPNAIEILTEETRYLFSSFLHRNRAYQLLMQQWTRLADLELQVREASLPAAATATPDTAGSPTPICSGGSTGEEEKRHQRASGVLTVWLVEFKGLPTNLAGTVDPFCTVAYGETVLRTSKVLQRSKNPVFNEPFHIKVTSTDIEGDALIAVFDNKDGELIGTFQLEVSRYLDGRHDRWFTLETRDAKGFYFRADSTCQIHIRTAWRPREEVEQLFWQEMVKLFDGDKDGLLSQAELAGLLEAMGNPTAAWPTDDWADLLAALDRGRGDGCVAAADLQVFTRTDRWWRLLRRCPICGLNLSTTPLDEHSVFHLGLCVLGHPCGLNEYVSRGQLNYEVSLKTRLSKAVSAPFKGGRAPAVLLVLDRKSGKLVEEKIPPYIKLAMKAVYKSWLGKAVGAQKSHKLMRALTEQHGRKYSDPASRRYIAPFIRYYGIDVCEFHDELESFATFNEFFYRKLKPGARPIAEPGNPRRAACPADCRLLVFDTIDEATRLWIKGDQFTLGRLVQDEQLAGAFAGGSLAVCRLAPQDYHRFHFPVDAVVGPSVCLGDKYFTVNPIAVRLPSANVFTENKRVMTLLCSEEFGCVLYIAVGATMVGSVVLTAREGQRVSKGDEAGYFAFGGSTVLVLFQRGAIQFDDDLLKNSARPVETLVAMGMSLGVATGSGSASPSLMALAFPIFASASSSSSGASVEQRPPSDGPSPPRSPSPPARPVSPPASPHSPHNGIDTSLRPAARGTRKPPPPPTQLVHLREYATTPPPADASTSSQTSTTSSSSLLDDLSQLPSIDDGFPFFTTSTTTVGYEYYEYLEDEGFL